MKIVTVDPQARVLSEQEILALLRGPILMRLGMVDGHGWPVVMPVWHVFEGGIFNSSLDGNVRRAIDLHEGEKIDEEALKALVRAAVILNESSARR